jgi:hypothetical protein
MDVKRIDKVFIKGFQMKKSVQLLICYIKIIHLSKWLKGFISLLRNWAA